jgi:hypothetical protein
MTTNSISFNAGMTRNAPIRYRTAIHISVPARRAKKYITVTASNPAAGGFRAHPWPSLNPLSRAPNGS